MANTHFVIRAGVPRDVGDFARDFTRTFYCAEDFDFIVEMGFLTDIFRWAYYVLKV